MKKLLILIGTLILMGTFFYSRSGPIQLVTPKTPTNLWQIRSIDTVKYSRDIAREKENDPEFDTVISLQVENIAKTGANYIALGTPYDSEFVPFLGRWVAEARKNNLKVWFRGNFSGWEGWFSYPKITRTQHLKLTDQFILNNPDLFENGDIFTTCSECENGGPGDPRTTGDVVGHRQFLISQYQVSQQAFAKINKNVKTGYFSMNGDVARLIMDRDTTKAVGGVVVIDHYVKGANILIDDIQKYAQNTGGKIILGEFGAPIPDIHGNMTEEEQSEWLKEVLMKLKDTPELIGLNYWVSVGGSTQLWKENGESNEAVEVIKKYYLMKKY